MKIKMTRKQMAIAVLLVIIVPIIYNKVSGAFVGLLQRQAMMQPKEVVIDNPEMKKLYDRGLALNEELRRYRKEMFRNLENDEIEM